MWARFYIQPNKLSNIKAEDNQNIRIQRIMLPWAHTAYDYN